MWIGPIVILSLLAWMSNWTGDERPNAELITLWVFVTSMPWALIWLGAAVGFGWPIQRLLARDSDDPLALQAGLGVAIMLFLDSAMGTTGMLQMGSTIGAWIPCLLGLLLLAEQFRRWMMSEQRIEIIWPWPVWMAAPSVAALLIATCAAPGWLWESEFGGYDAMSYHLQLPKEWLALGAIQPLDHNVYSHLPSFMEGAYYHLAVLVGDGVESVYASQMLHGLITLLTAVLVGRLAARHAGPMGGLIAGLILLGTPWTIVTGSLAYNEMAVTLMLVTGLIVLESKRLAAHHEAALLGICIGAACGAKLTAGGFVALPLLILFLWKHHAKHWPTLGSLIVLLGALMLGPYFVSNAMDTGNPVFPFLTDLFGTGHWTAQQAETWALGHQVDGGVVQRLSDSIHQFVRYGIGLNPNDGEPWSPQWSVLPLLGMLALLMGLSSSHLRARSLRLVVILIVQVGFWIFLTHVKSRFMLPSVVPLALSIALAYEWVLEFGKSIAHDVWTRVIIAVLLLGWCCFPAYLYSREKGGAPSAKIDWAGIFSGAELDEGVRLDWARNTSSAIYINFILDRDAKVLMVGNATPLYVLKPVAYQTTWDRGPLSRILRESGDNPAGWIDSLRYLGFTHLLVAPNMLRNWENEGWNDPLITASRIQGVADRFATVECRYPNGTVLYQLQAPVMPTLPSAPRP